MGGWNKKGIDPGIFARELCSHVQDGFTDQSNLKELLVQSVQKTKPMGSSTFVMAALDKEDPQLRTVNLGDSGYTILRASDNHFSQVYRSTE